MCCLPELYRGAKDKKSKAHVNQVDEIQHQSARRLRSWKHLVSRLSIPVVVADQETLRKHLSPIQDSVRCSRFQNGSHNQQPAHPVVWQEADADTDGGFGRRR